MSKMKAMGSSGKGIRLTTGELLGTWTMDDNDGVRAAPLGGQDPTTVPLPSSSSGAVDEGEADEFADR